MKITVLTENTSAHGLPYEHGLSLYIETQDKTILFDAGQSELFADNAGSLGIDLNAVDFAVLSHGHYDHSGGMKRFLALNDHAPLYLSHYAFDTHLNANGKDIGIDSSLQTSGRLIYTDGQFEISNNITLYPADSIPRLIDFGSAGLSTVKGGKIFPDDFRHEQYLLIREGGKTVLFSGCAHKGITNIVDRFRPDIVFGGFHFMKLPLDHILRGYAKKLNAYDTAYYTCHCTGMEQYHFIEPYIKKLHYISAGDVAEV